MDSRLSDTFRNVSFIAIILVVFIHYGDLSTPEIRSESLNYFIQDFIQNGIARSAVPSFALISGFLFAYKSNGFQLSIGRRIKSLIMPYLVSSLFAFACYTIIHHVNNFNLIESIYAIFITPYNGQLWFLRDLIVITLLSPIFFIISRNMFFSAIMSLFLAILWFLEIQPTPIIGWHIINIEVFFYFIFGSTFYLLWSKHKIASGLCKVILYISFPLWMLLTFVRCYMYPEFDLWYTRDFSFTSLLLQKASIFCGVITLFSFFYTYRLNFPAWITSVSFFVFLFHNYPFVPLSRTVFSFLGEFRFYVTAPLFTCLFIIVGITLRRLAPKTYEVISGGR
ncbi:acyltransferase [Providencia rettgeri]|nr:acyltransferase [Providencia rettgeri]